MDINVVIMQGVVQKIWDVPGERQKAGSFSMVVEGRESFKTYIQVRFTSWSGELPGEGSRVTVTGRLESYKPQDAPEKSPLRHYVFGTVDVLSSSFRRPTDPQRARGDRGLHAGEAERTRARRGDDDGKDYDMRADDARDLF